MSLFDVIKYRVTDKFDYNDMIEIPAVVLEGWWNEMYDLKLCGGRNRNRDHFAIASIMYQWSDDYPDHHEKKRMLALLKKHIAEYESI